jgi:hypothetical protein
VEASLPVGTQDIPVGTQDIPVGTQDFLAGSETEEEGVAGLPGME